MRLLYLNPTGQLGGAETSLLEVLASVRESEPTWDLRLILAADGPLVARARALDVRTIVLPFPPAVARLGEAGVSGSRRRYMVLAGHLVRAGWPAWQYVKQLREVIREFKPAVIHTNGLKMHLLGVWADEPPSAVVWHLHDYLKSRPLTASLLRRCASGCAAVIANSRSVADDARSVLEGGLPVVPVHNAVDLDRFSPLGPVADLDQLAGLPPAGAETVRVGLLAAFGRWKGHLTFLTALSMLPAALPVRAYVIGGALYETEDSQYSIDELKRLVHELGLDGRVAFTGFVKQPEHALRALDIVVHASTEPEPFGLVIAEAMACGRAVIISEAGGAREIVRPGIDALGHPPGDARALAMRIEQLVRDPGLRARLGEAGRRAAEQRFDRARLSGQILPIYRLVAAA